MDDKELWFGILPEDIVTCPVCNLEDLGKDWEETEVGCEDCGSHPAIKCPNCEEKFDHIRGQEKFEGKIKRQ